MSGKETVQPEPEFVAFVGIDWADQKHVWCLQAANSAQQEDGELEHKPEVVEAWVSELCQRFGHGPIAVAVEQVKGALVYIQYGPSQPEFLTIAGPAAEGFVWSTVLGVYNDAQGAAFRKKYAAAYF
jgi:hypothetical protein